MLADRLKSHSKNISLSILSLALIFLIFEFFIFRFVFPASDVPCFNFEGGVIKLKPNKQGLFRIKNEIRAEYNINSHGWNSRHKEYTSSTKKYRIAIIGDSFVEARHVDYDKSVAERLEDKLGNESYEVYRFGISVAPMSQYLHMLRKEVLNYSPNLIIIILIHNDFNESYQFYSGDYNSSFLKFMIEDSLVLEIQPKEFRLEWYRRIARKSATWRFLSYRQQRFWNILDLIGETIEVKKVQANIDLAILENNNKNELVTNYVFQKVKEICDRNGMDLLILMDGDRLSIEAGVDSNLLYANGALSLNLIAKSVAKKHNIGFVDLHPIFEEDYSIHKKTFAFKADNHWNAYTHDLVADVILNSIKVSLPNHNTN